VAQSPQALTFSGASAFARSRAFTPAPRRPPRSLLLFRPGQATPVSATWASFACQWASFACQLSSELGVAQYIAVAVISPLKTLRPQSPCEITRTLWPPKSLPSRNSSPEKLRDNHDHFLPRGRLRISPQPGRCGCGSKTRPLFRRSLDPAPPGSGNEFRLPCRNIARKTSHCCKAVRLLLKRHSQTEAF
jgi:hypothetical protein